MRRLWPGALFLALLASACATARRPESPSAETVAGISLADVRQSLDARRHALRSLRSIARFSYDSPDESRTVRQLLLLRRPDRLRTELFSPFGTEFVLVIDGARLTAYAPREKAAWEGAASAANLGRYTRLPLEVPTVVDLLFGIPPVEVLADASLSADAGEIRVLEGTREEMKAAWFGRGLEPRRYELWSADGTVRARAWFDAYSESGGVRIPNEVSIEVPSRQQTVRISLSDPEVNVELADASFVFEVPPGSKRTSLDRP